MSYLSSNDFLSIFEEHGTSRDKITPIRNGAVLADIPVLKKANEWSQARGWLNHFVFLDTGTPRLKHDRQAFFGLGKGIRGRSKRTYRGRIPGVSDLHNAALPLCRGALSA